MLAKFGIKLVVTLSIARNVRDSGEGVSWRIVGRYLSGKCTFGVFVVAWTSLMSSNLIFNVFIVPHDINSKVIIKINNFNFIQVYKVPIY